MTEENKTKEEPSADNEPPSQSPPAPKKTKSTGGFLLRGLTYLLFSLFFLFAGAGLALKYFFPVEQVRVLAENQLSKTLKIPLRIQKLDYSLLSGIQLDNITLGTATNALIQVKQVVLDYDLTQLVLGKLVINQVLVDHPQLTAISKNGVWNFAPLLEQDTTPANKNPSALMAFMPTLNIKELLVRNASAHINQDGKLNAHINGLTLQAQGKASLKNIDLQLKILLAPDKNEKPNLGFQSLGAMSFQSRGVTDLNISVRDLNHFLVSGTLALQNSKARMKTSALPTPDFRLEMDTEISLKPETLHLKKIHLTFDDDNQIKFSGRVVDFTQDPSFQLQVHTASLQLEKLLTWGKQWMPPLTGQGLLQAKAVNASGILQGSTLKSLNIMGGMLATKNLWLNYPDQNAQLENMNASLELQEVTLNDSQLKNAAVNITLQLEKGRAQKIELNNWRQSLSLKAKAVDDVFWQFNSDLKSLHFDHPDTHKIFLPVHAEGSGHFHKNDINRLKLSYKLGNLANGTLTGSLKNFGKNSIQFDQSLSLNLAEVTSQVPERFSAPLPQGLTGRAKMRTSLSGKLDAKFAPAELKGQANIQLENLTADLKQPTVHINQLDTRIDFPIEFRFDKGVRIAKLDIHTELHEAEALQAWKVSTAKLDTKITTSAFYNFQPDFGTLPVQVETQISFDTLSNPQPALSLANFKTDLTLKTDLLSEDVRNTHAEGTLSFEDLSAIKTFKAGGWTSQFNLDVHDKSLSRVRFSQKTRVNKPSINQDGLGLNLASVSLATTSRLNLKDGDVNIDRLLLQSPDLIDARLKAALHQWGKSFELEGKIASLQLGSLWKHVPVSYKTELENINLGGDIAITLQAKGSLPNPMQNESGKNGAPPLWLQLLDPAKIDKPAKIELFTEMRLKDGFLENPDSNFRAEHLNTQARLTFEKSHINLFGNFSGNLESQASISLNPEFKFGYDLSDLNVLQVNQHHFTMKNSGVEHSLKGSVEGLKPFITGQRPIDLHQLLNRVDIDLVNKNHIHINQTKTAEKLFSDLKIQGSIASEVNLHQSAGKTLQVKGKIGFDKFSLHLPSGVTLNNLNGNFPFTKTLNLDTKQLQQKKHAFFPAQKKFFTPLRNFSRYKNIIHADTLEVKGQTLSDIGLDVVFKDNSLMAEKFIFDVLGGSVGGNLFLIQDRDGPVLKFSSEFAGVDSAKLLALPTTKEVDAKIDGNLQMRFKIKTGAEGQPVSLQQLSIRVAITRIGAQTLDRLLLFLDPEESKPAIMDTRAKLKLATPHQVLINLENGNLSVEAWLTNDLLGTFKAPELKRVPVAKLKRFQTLHHQLQKLKDLQQISNYLSARGVHFEDNEMILHY